MNMALGQVAASRDEGGPGPGAPGLHMVRFRVLSQSGDDRLAWDRRDVAQIREARDKFYGLLGTGHSAFAVGPRGGKGQKMDEFDPEAEEVIFVPATTKG